MRVLLQQLIGSLSVGCTHVSPGEFRYNFMACVVPCERGKRTENGEYCYAGNSFHDVKPEELTYFPVLGNHFSQFRPNSSTFSFVTRVSGELSRTLVGFFFEKTLLSRCSMPR